MSYDEHLISMAGGDGEPDLDAIQKRWDLAQRTLANDPNIVSVMQLHRLSESADDVPALLALVRSQQAQIERVRELCSEWDAVVDVFPLTPAALFAGSHAKRVRAALTATEGA